MLIGNARKKAGIAAAVILFGIMGLTAGCGTTAQKSNAVSVKTMKVLQQDVSVSHDYSGSTIDGCGSHQAKCFRFYCGKVFYQRAGCPEGAAAL